MAVSFAGNSTAIQEMFKRVAVDRLKIKMVRFLKIICFGNGEMQSSWFPRGWELGMFVRFQLQKLIKDRTVFAMHFRYAVSR